MCKNLSETLNSAVDALSSAVDGLYNAVKSVWDNVVMPVVDVIASVFGFNAQDILVVQSTSQKMYSTTPTDAFKQLMIQTSRMKNADNGIGLLESYIINVQSKTLQTTGYFNYGKNSYVNGLPTANITVNTVDKASVKAVLDPIVGVGVTVIKAEFKYPNKYELYYPYLQTTYSFKYSTNLLTLTTSELVNNIATNITRADWSLDSILYNYTTGVYEFTATNLTTNAVHTEALPNYSLIKSYIITYYITDPTDIVYATSLDPAITMSNKNVSNLEMMPVAILRENKRNINATKTTVEYKTTKDLLKRIDLDIDTITQSIVDTKTDTGTNAVDNIEDIFIYFALNPADYTTSTPEIAKALYNMMEAMFDSLLITSGTTTDANGNIVDTTAYLVTFVEGIVNIAITWDTQSYTSITGSIGAVGLYTSSINDTTHSLTTRYQITATTYIEIIFTNMKSLTMIRNSSGLSNTSPATLSTDVNSGFNIPLSVNTITRLSNKEQVLLLPNILRLNMNSAQVQHLAWYETPSFLGILSAVLQVVSIVLLFYGNKSLSKFVQALATRLVVSAVIKRIVANIEDPILRAAVATGLSFIAFSELDVGFDPDNLTIELVTDFANNVSGNTQVEMQKIQQEKLRDEAKYKDRKKELDKFLAVAAERQSNTDYTQYLKSFDTNMYLSRDVQYNFDVPYNYDNTIKEFHNNKLLTGVV